MANEQQTPADGSVQETGENARKKSRKPTKVERSRRVNDAFKALMLGKTSGEITAYLSDKYGVTQRTAERYIADAGVKLEEVALAEQRDALRNALSRLSNLYATAYTLRDMRTALSVQKEINALLGLYPPQKREISGAFKVDGGLVSELEALGLDVAEVLQAFVEAAKWQR